MTCIKKLILFAVVLATFLPLSVGAKSSPPHLIIGRSTSIKADYLTISSDKKIEVEADVYSKDFSIIRVEGARPWRLFSRPKKLTVTLAGLTPGTKYYLYKEKLHNPDIFTPDSSGAHTISLDTPRHRYLILKTTPSTYHIDAGDGGDCNDIGAWNQASLTCTLSPTATINDTIEIDDGGITLDGNGRMISHSADIGIYANKDPIFDDSMANITIKNLTVTGPTIGIGLFYLPQFTLTHTSTTNSSTGISLKDDQNISITRTNFIANVDDLTATNTSGTILSNSQDRGNYWSKNATCIQDPNSPDHCTKSYTTAGIADAMPWACENGWEKACPYTPLPTPTIIPTNSESSTPTPNETTYGICQPGGNYLEVISGINGRVPLLETASPASKVMKEIPNGWVLHIEDMSDAQFYKVKDLGTTPLEDSKSIGYIEVSNVCTNPSRKIEFEKKTTLADSNSNNDISTRKAWIKDAALNYLNNTNATDQLYAREAGRDGNNDFERINTYPKLPHILMAMIRQESGMTNNNRVCSSDKLGGFGILQITTPKSTKGMGANMTRVSDSTYTASQTAYFDDCYGSGGLQAGLGYYYTNTMQGIFAAVKDGLRVFRDKFDRTVTAIAIDSITQQEMRFASAVYRYNQGSPFKAQLAYEAFSSPLDATDLRTYLVENGYKKIITEQFLIGRTESLQVAWLKHIKDTCTGKDFKECLSLLTADHTFKAPPLYLEGVGSHLKVDNFGSQFVDSDLGDKFIKINYSSLIMGLASPAELQAINPTGKRTGSFSGKVIQEIGNTWYDPDLESITLLFPNSDNKYNVVGKTDGTYDYVVIKPTNDDISTFVALGIPTHAGAVHSYSVDWKAVLAGSQDAVKISIDNDGDGVFELTFSSDRKLMSEEFKKVSDNKVLICHNDPKNPHTISIASPAINAHLAHGDFLGECALKTSPLPTVLPNSINNKKSKKLHEE